MRTIREVIEEALASTDMMVTVDALLEIERLLDAEDGPCPACGRKRKAKARLADPGTSFHAASLAESDDNFGPKTHKAKILRQMSNGAPWTDLGAGVQAGVHNSDSARRRCSDLRLYGYIALTGAVGINPNGSLANLSRITSKGHAKLTSFDG